MAFSDVRDLGQRICQIENEAAALREQEPGERGLIARYQEVIAADETIASLCGHRPTVEDGPWNEALRRRERALAAIGVETDNAPSS